MRFFRPLLFALFFLTLGFGVGRMSQSKPESVAASISPPGVLKTPEPIHASTLSPSALPSLQAATPPPAATEPSLRVRTQTIAWLKKQEVFLQLQPVLGDSFNHQLVAVLDLTPAETERLDSEFRQTKQHLDAALSQTATAQVSADRKKLTVTVPPAVAAGSAAYSSLVMTLKQVLGPERYQLFNEITGNGFDHTFDSFGLNTVNYEVSLEPLNNGGTSPSYAFKQSYVSADNTESGWGNSTLDRSTLEKSFPVLSRFLTPDLIK